MIVLIVISYVLIYVFWFWWVWCQGMQNCSQAGGHLRYDDIKLVWCCWTVVRFQVECWTWHTLTYWTNQSWSSPLSTWICIMGRALVKPRTLESADWNGMLASIYFQWELEPVISHRMKVPNRSTYGECPIWWSSTLKVVANNRLLKY